MADAAVMYIAEQEGIDTLFTLDRRNSSVYRTTDGRESQHCPGSLNPLAALARQPAQRIKIPVKARPARGVVPRLKAS
jgi:hypothetical protein